jgi:hypothetical protein
VIAVRQKTRFRTKFLIKQMVLSLVVHGLLQCIVKAFSCHIMGDGHTFNGAVPPPDAAETAFAWLMNLSPSKEPISPDNLLFAGE